MKFLNTLAKLMAALAAVAAAAAVIYRLIERHNEKMDELDAYLMDDPDETVENQSLEPGMSNTSTRISENGIRSTMIRPLKFPS